MLRKLLEFFFPPQCGGCGAIGNGACDACLPSSGLRFSETETLAVTALGAYEGAVRRIVLALKRGRRDVAMTLAARLCELASPEDLLIAVPTTAARRRERGFDGCVLLARAAAQHAGCEMREGLVQVAGDRQRGRTRDARLAARGRFRWSGSPLDGKRVTLVDDVVTTGSTLEDCAQVLRSAGALVERAIVVAMA